MARSESDEAIQYSLFLTGLLRGACHQARIRATRWLAMTAFVSAEKLSTLTAFLVPRTHRSHFLMAVVGGMPAA
jgi:hypothetical protein